jgi:hypothetical protein
LSIISFQSGFLGLRGFDEDPRVPRFDPRVGAMFRWFIVGLIGFWPNLFDFPRSDENFRCRDEEKR